MTWETVPLGMVSRYVRGVTFKPVDVVDPAMGVACLRTKNIQRELDLSDLVYVKPEVRHRIEQRVRPNDVLISSANSWHLVGKAVRATENAVGMLIGGFIGGLRFDPSQVDPAFGYRWFTSSAIQQRVRNFGQQTTNIANLNVDRTMRLPFPLPPLPEQRRIAAIIDEADALGTVRAAQRAQSMATIEAEIQRVLASVESTSPFRSLTSEPFRNGISPSRVGKVEAEVLTLSAITRGGFDPGARKRDTFAAPHSGDKLVREGLHLICRGNGNADLVGAMAVATAGLENVAFPDTMIATRPSAAISSAALAAAWRSDAVREQIRRGARTTNGTYKINQQLLGSIEVPVPSADQQLRIGELNAEKLRSTSLFDASLARTGELFASLQHRAFRGEL